MRKDAEQLPHFCSDHSQLPFASIFTSESRKVALEPLDRHMLEEFLFTREQLVINNMVFVHA